MNSPLSLSKLEPFAKGGNRACYLDPRDRNRVLKVLRSGKSPAERRARAPFPKNIRPLHFFDDNDEEYRNLRWIEKKWGEVPLIPKLYGIVETDLGPAISTQLFRDYDGLIAKTLEYYLWRDGYNDSWQQIVADFITEWKRYSIPTRSLMLYNIVAVRDQEQYSLKLIDDFGLSESIPFVRFSRTLRRRKVARRVAAISEKIDKLIACKEEAPGHDKTYRSAVLMRNEMLTAMARF